MLEGVCVVCPRDSGVCVLRRRTVHGMEDVSPLPS